MLNKILQSHYASTIFFLSSAIFVGLFTVIIKDTGMDTLSVITTVFLAISILSGFVTYTQRRRGN